MRWRPSSAASDPPEGAYSVPTNLTPGFEGVASRYRREKEKRCERIGERERKERGRKVVEGMEGRGRVKGR